jgi:hypothetical protein
LTKFGESSTLVGKKGLEGWPKMLKIQFQRIETVSLSEFTSENALEIHLFASICHKSRIAVGLQEACTCLLKMGCFLRPREFPFFANSLIFQFLHGHAKPLLNSFHFRPEQSSTSSTIIE